MRVALAAIGTGRYATLLRPLFESAERFFFRGQDRLFLALTDDPRESPPNAIYQSTPHYSWPGPTLYRYRSLLAAADYLRSCDYVFHCDADMLFVGNVSEKICSNGLTAVRHPGYGRSARRRLPFEQNRRSRAYITPEHGTTYYAGGFQGGAAAAYLAAIEELAEAIDDDDARGVTAAWHDESHWNRLLADHPPAVTLDRRFCCPEQLKLPGRRILALDKNHAELRQ